MKNCLSDIKILTPNPKKRKLFEIEIERVPLQGNPFNPEELAVDAKVFTPDGKTLALAGFYYEKYEMSNDSLLIGEKKGEGTFRVRFSPPTEGSYKMDISLSINGEVCSSQNICFDVADSDEKGYLRIEPKRRQMFQFDNGEIYVPIGQNLCTTAQPHDKADIFSYYSDHLTKMADNEANYIRLWLSPFSMGLYTCGLAPDDFSGRMSHAFALDSIIELMEKLGIYCSFTIWQHIYFSRFFFPMWHECPFNTDNGGYLSEPSYFFTNERAKKDAKKYLRYVAARWGHTQNIFCYEMFSEIDGCETDEKSALEWHEEMMAYLREIDIYKHITTTSTANTASDIMRNKMFDFIYYHTYTNDFIKELRIKQTDSFNTFGKPVIYGEMGITGNAAYLYDPQMISFHQANWAGVMISGSGTAMNWWWDKLDEENKYYEFRGISRFSKLIPWADGAMRYVNETAFEVSSSDFLVNGYKTAYSLYLWIMDSEYSFFQSLEKDKEIGKIMTKNIDDGIYTVLWYDFVTGVLTTLDDAEVKNNELMIEVSDNKTDIFINLTPKSRVIKNETINVQGMIDKTYDVRWYDTVSGDIVFSEQKAATDGLLELIMPEWSKDIALTVC